MTETLDGSPLAFEVTACSPGPPARAHRRPRPLRARAAPHHRARHPASVVPQGRRQGRGVRDPRRHQLDRALVPARGRAARAPSSASSSPIISWAGLAPPRGEAPHESRWRADRPRSAAERSRTCRRRSGPRTRCWSAVAGCGVCHTDIGFWSDGVPTRHALPLTLGHEVSGVVDAGPGEACRHWSGREVIVPGGDPVRRRASSAARAAATPAGRRSCRATTSTAASPSRSSCRGAGSASVAGAARLRARRARRWSPTRSPRPTRRWCAAGSRPGDLAIVVGAGGVGGYAVQIAAALGARVVAIDVDDARLAAIAPHGAELTLNARDARLQDAQEGDRDRRRRRGAAPPHGWKIFECSGTTAGQETAFGLLGTAATLHGDRLHARQDRGAAEQPHGVRRHGAGHVGLPPRALPRRAPPRDSRGRVTLKPFIERHPLAAGADMLHGRGAPRAGRSARPGARS